MVDDVLIDLPDHCLLLLLLVFPLGSSKEYYRSYFEFLTAQIYSICIIIIPESPRLRSATYFPFKDSLAEERLFDFHGARVAALAITLKTCRRYGMRASVWSALECVCLKGGRVTDKGVRTSGNRVVYEQWGLGRDERQMQSLATFRKKNLIYKSGKVACLKSRHACSCFPW